MMVIGKLDQAARERLALVEELHRECGAVHDERLVEAALRGLAA